MHKPSVISAMNAVSNPVRANDPPRTASIGINTAIPPYGVNKKIPRFGHKQPYRQNWMFEHKFTGAFHTDLVALSLRERIMTCRCDVFDIPRGMPENRISFLHVPPHYLDSFIRA